MNLPYHESFEKIAMELKKAIFCPEKGIPLIIKESVFLMAF